MNQDGARGSDVDLDLDLDAERSDERPVRVLRRSALAQDFLLFCVAFTVGALVVLVVSILGESEVGDAWSLGRSDDLLLGGLVAGELFLLWNNGWRQGVRGHSIGKHREGLVVVDVESEQPTGGVRGLARGVLLAALLDLAVAAVPIGLPTVLRRFTPDAWHVGAFAYIAVLVLVVPLVLRTDRGLVDRLLGTKVVKGAGQGAVITDGRRHALLVLNIVGVAGVLAVCVSYLSFFWPLLWQWPALT